MDGARGLAELEIGRLDPRLLAALAAIPALDPRQRAAVIADAPTDPRLRLALAIHAALAPGGVDRKGEREALAALAPRESEDPPP